MRHLLLLLTTLAIGTGGFATELNFTQNKYEINAVTNQAFHLDLNTLLKGGASASLKWGLIGTAPYWINVSRPGHLTATPPTEALGDFSFRIAVRNTIGHGAMARIRMRVTQNPINPIQFKQDAFEFKLKFGLEVSIDLPALLRKVRTQGVAWGIDGSAPHWVNIKNDNLVAEAPAAGTFRFKLFAVQSGFAATTNISLIFTDSQPNNPPQWNQSAILLSSFCAGDTLITDLKPYVEDPDGDALTFSVLTQMTPQPYVSKVGGQLAVPTLASTQAGTYQAQVAAHDKTDSASVLILFEVVACTD